MSRLSAPKARQTLSERKDTPAPLGPRRVSPHFALGRDPRSSVFMMAIEGFPEGRLLVGEPEFARLLSLLDSAERGINTGPSSPAPGCPTDSFAWLAARAPQG